MSSLTQREKDKIEYLLAKLKEKTLPKDEGLELQTLLQREKEEASKTGNFLIATGAALLLAGLAGYLAQKVDLFEHTPVGNHVSVKKKSNKRNK